ncbi:BCL2 binding component 3 [Homo sapiens]|uniref:Bcl-2-binding component 3, isoforms 3/4 n=1 Tax=Homo sapiens TaxID=9606 RepID=BBC3B_HUMAN|nr:bcl-2-binding component 3 isoform 1 [Homo sapiens]Q96PG8.2 RecName: Full=Bcl-2-binding component 3, isoforms 3/4; AltName: Full=JFY-1; AltName: Full=p53 up-regulated modulator of apoptosis [Homo sapiens]KAI2591947.1 BCL2 binding component 3 [Homo sapiens]KAI4043608.1 BCL2 binding component 3 [Homo sapiens]|eukprot:NP_001120712.1 bcl-2-binding component 3 isoform 1 [Homo sapiens]
MKFGMGSAQACPCQVPRAASTTWVPCQICGPRERHGPRTPGGQLPGARRGPGPRRPAPLPARPPGALGSVLRPLRARPGCRPRRPHPAARCLPLRPHRPTRRHRRPGGFPLAWGSPQPAPRPAPGRSSALALAGGAAPGVARAQRPGGSGGRSHPGGPGSPRGGGTVGPGDRGPAAADGGRPQRTVRAAETRGAAAAPPLTLEGPVQSHHGTPALTQGPQSPRDGAQLGACTRPVDVRDSGGRPLPPPDTLASAGDFLCTM